MAEAQALLDGAAAADLASLRDGEALSVPGLRALSPLQRINAVRFWLCEADAEAPSTARLSEALRQVLDARARSSAGDRLGQSPPCGAIASACSSPPADPPRLEGLRPWRSRPDARLDLGPGLGNLTWVTQTRRYCGRSACPRAVTVRRRDGGETLQARSPQRRTQSVQHLCQSQGVLPWMRDALPLVFAGDALIAVADLWLDARWCAPADAPGLAVQWRGAPIVV